MQTQQSAMHLNVAHPGALHLNAVQPSAMYPSTTEPNAVCPGTLDAADVTWSMIKNRKNLSNFERDHLMTEFVEVFKILAEYIAKHPRIVLLHELPFDWQNAAHLWQRITMPLGYYDFHLTTGATVRLVSFNSMLQTNHMQEPKRSCIQDINLAGFADVVADVMGPGALDGFADVVADVMGPDVMGPGAWNEFATDIEGTWDKFATDIEGTWDKFATTAADVMGAWDEDEDEDEDEFEFI